MSSNNPLRLLIAAVALAISTAGALANDYACRALEGEFEGDPGVEITFTLDYSGDEVAVTKAAFQIEGDIGYSTTTTEPTALATITGLIVDHYIEFSFHYKDDGYEGDVAKLHIVTFSEGAHWITAGAFHAVAGGLYAVRCDSTE